VVVIILNDRRHGTISKSRICDFGCTYQAELRSPGLARFAESSDAAGIRVEDDSEPRDAFSRALTVDSSVIVDMVSGYDFPYPSPEQWLRRSVQWEWVSYPFLSGRVLRSTGNAGCGLELIQDDKGPWMVKDNQSGAGLSAAHFIL
jgi:hypothetical protein